MKLREIKELLACYNLDEYSIWSKIKCIKLKNNICIYPNLNMRFKLNKNKIRIIYGDLQPFGFILKNPEVCYSLDYLEADGVYKTAYYDYCRFPNPGDILRISKNGKILSEAFVNECIWTGKNISITLINKLKVDPNNILGTTVSFYSPTEIKKESVVGESMDGIYLNFIQYKSKKGYHQQINIRDIVEIKKV